MKSLVSVLTNIFYTKEKNTEKYKKVYELVLLLNESEYSLRNSDEIVKNRSIRRECFFLSERGLDQLIEQLEHIRDYKD